MIINEIHIPDRIYLRRRSISYLDNLYWKLFSRWIRLKSANPRNGIVRCFICGLPVHWTQAHCSHYMKRSHICTRYSLLNNHACCSRCNVFMSGNLEAYRKKLNLRYGEGTADKLEYLARQTCKADRAEYIDGIYEMKKRLKQYE